MSRIKNNIIIKIILIFVLIVSSLFSLSSSADAVGVIISTRIVSCTVNDYTPETGYYHVCVYMTNNFTGCIYDISPASWVLEWQALKDDGAIYSRGNRSGKFVSAVASNKEEFFFPALTSGYFKYRLIVSNDKETVTGDWDVVSVGNHGGHSGGGRPRSICLQM